MRDLEDLPSSNDSIPDIVKVNRRGQSVSVLDLKNVPA